MSSSLLLLRCPRLIWIVLEVGVSCPNSFCFEGSCFQDLIKIAFLCNSRQTFSLYAKSASMWCISRIDMTAARKKSRFILLDKFDFHMIENLSIPVHVFARRILMSFSGDETMLLRLRNLSTSFREPRANTLICGLLKGIWLNRQRGDWESSSILLLPQ